MRTSCSSSRPAGVSETSERAPVGRVGRALDDPVLLEPREHARHRRALHALALRQLARGERAVALDRREHRALRRAEADGALLAQPARGARDREAQAGREVRAEKWFALLISLANQTACDRGGPSP